MTLFWWHNITVTKLIISLLPATATHRKSHRGRCLGWLCSSHGWGHLFPHCSTAHHYCSSPHRALVHWKKAPKKRWLLMFSLHEMQWRFSESSNCHIRCNSLAAWIATKILHKEIICYKTSHKNTLHNI